MEFFSSDDFKTRAHEIANLPVETLMRTNVITCGPMDAVIRVGALMLAHGIHRLPVVDGDKIVGIVDRMDIFHEVLEKEFLLEEKKSQERKARAVQKKVKAKK